MRFAREPRVSRPVTDEKVFSQFSIISLAALATLDK